MNRARAFELARNEGSLTAQRTLQRLHVDQTAPINIFRIVQEEGLWLLFQPMDGPLGAYLRTESGSGVLINTKRPRSVQRLTAAHEFGHHLLGHEASLDDRRDIEGGGRARAYKEAAAQAFATDFLMPPQLVNRMWAELGLPTASDQVDGRQSYLLSLYLGASYAATIHQLVSLHKLNPKRADDLLRIQPKVIKREISGGIGPGEPTADVWPLAFTDHGRVLHVRVNDELSISLPEAPSTGYIWTVEGPSIEDRRGEASQQTLILAEPMHIGPPANGEDYLALRSDGFEGIDRRSATTLVGADGSRYLGLVALKSGKCRLRLALRRPWQRSEVPLQTFDLDLIIEPKPTGDVDTGPPSNIKPRFRLPIAA